MSINDKICIMGDFNYPSIKWNGILTHVGDFEFVEANRDSHLYQMATKSTRSRIGQTANINDPVLVNDELFSTEMEHSCPLGENDHQVHKFSMHSIDCLFDLSTCSKTVSDISKADFHSSNYDNWTLLLDMNLNES